MIAGGCIPLTPCGLYAVGVTSLDVILGTPMPSIRKLVFVDANIWLDFYRARSEAGMALLARLEEMSQRIVVTYQLEMEVKKNRQAAMLEGFQELKALQNVPRPGLFSNAKAAKSLKSNVDKANTTIKKLKARLVKALENPATSDPVSTSPGIE